MSGRGLGPRPPVADKPWGSGCACGRLAKSWGSRAPHCRVQCQTTGRFCLGCPVPTTQTFSLAPRTFLAALANPRHILGTPASQELLLPAPHSLPGETFWPHDPRRPSGNRWGPASAERALLGGRLDYTCGYLDLLSGFREGVGSWASLQGHPFPA